jgi:murein DD-endopeptidase MepM/ murein hydrolase activator NlpD
MGQAIWRAAASQRVTGWDGELFASFPRVGADVERTSAPAFDTFLSQWRRQTRGAVAIVSDALSTTDGRWAMVSTSLTALIAGSIAILAATTMPPMTARSYDSVRDHSMMPYELFQRLAGRNGNSAFAGLGPTGPIAGRSRIDTGTGTQVDNALAAQEMGDDNSGVDTRTITMDSGDTLKGALTDAGVSNDDANAAVIALSRVYDLRSLRAGQAFTATFSPTADSASSVPQTTEENIGGDEDGSAPVAKVIQIAPTPAGKLLSIAFSPTIEHDVDITRNADGTFAAQDVQKVLKMQYHRAGATIDSSLYLAAMQAGIPADVVVEMIHMFSYEVDFQRDMHPGDSFEVMYSYYYTPEGVPAKDGNIAYATMHLGGRTVTLYRYQPDPNDLADYFDAQGQSAKSMLMKTPVDGARITSGFGMRLHPVLGYTRMHKGIDFGVPVGTPVMAAGSGIVKLAGAASGYGNFLLINHENGYSTGYGHLSRFAPGIHAGSHVRQGQVVAYSGNTGLTTGPHLHYEIRINNIQVNPLKVKIATGRRLAGRDLRDFLVQRLHMDAELASMPLETKMADAAAGDLRTARP